MREREARVRGRERGHTLASQRATSTFAGCPIAATTGDSPFNVPPTKVLFGERPIVRGTKQREAPGRLAMSQLVVVD